MLSLICSFFIFCLLNPQRKLKFIFFNFIIFYVQRSLFGPLWRFSKFKIWLLQRWPPHDKSWAMLNLACLETILANNLIKRLINTKSVLLRNGDLVIAELHSCRTDYLGSAKAFLLSLRFFLFLSVRSKYVCGSTYFCKH